MRRTLSMQTFDVRSSLGQELPCGDQGCGNGTTAQGFAAE